MKNARRKKYMEVITEIMTWLFRYLKAIHSHTMLYIAKDPAAFGFQNDTCQELYELPEGKKNKLLCLLHTVGDQNHPPVQKTEQYPALSVKGGCPL